MRLISFEKIFIFDWESYKIQLHRHCKKIRARVRISLIGQNKIIVNSKRKMKFTKYQYFQIYFASSIFCEVWRSQQKREILIYHVSFELFLFPSDLEIFIIYLTVSLLMKNNLTIYLSVLSVIIWYFLVRFDEIVNFLVWRVCLYDSRTIRVHIKQILDQRRN